MVLEDMVIRVLEVIEANLEESLSSKATGIRVIEIRDQP